jgi:hypothetical protein
MDQKYIHSAARLPQCPDRETIPEHELAEFDHMVARIKTGFAQHPEIIDGKPYGVPHFEAMNVSPPLGAAVSRLGREIMQLQGKPGTFTGADHELIDIVLALDSGYYALLAGHTPAAIGFGIRIEAIEALRDHREETLNEDERQQVEFIRAVRDGGMTDEIWSRMKDRLGTERGVVEFVYFVLLLQLHHKFCWAVGAPEMLAEFKDGTRSPPTGYADWVSRAAGSEGPRA